ncbi:MAG: hypothetical protein J6Y31_04370 [Bacteroidales bacterium]|nr:hypothetical protein [Bacteroidales bacterium]MBP5374134.1 hypothetical protein [Bacteroidales bacterium]
MVGSSYIELHRLTLEELSGVVNLYPWYGAARMELCTRMSRMGGWSPSQFADEALYVPDRSRIERLLRGSSDCSDKDVKELVAALLEGGASEGGVRVVGGDYFSQAQYDKVSRGQDSIFARMAAKAPKDAPSEDESAAEMAERFPTETLARIFAEQGRSDEARRIYSRLVLDIPEKSAYFASLIDNLK